MIVENQDISKEETASPRSQTNSAKETTKSS